MWSARIIGHLFLLFLLAVTYDMDCTLGGHAANIPVLTVIYDIEQNIIYFIYINYIEYSTIYIRMADTQNAANHKGRLLCRSAIILNAFVFRVIFTCQSALFDQ